MVFIWKNETWTLFAGTIYNYELNGSNQINAITRKSYDEFTDEWYENIKEVYYLDANGAINTAVRYMPQGTGGELTKRDSLVITWQKFDSIPGFADHDEILMGGHDYLNVTAYAFDGSQYTLNWKKEKKYNAAGLPSEYLFYFVNDLFSRNTYAYNSNNDITGYVTYNLNGEVTSRMESEYAYDSDNDMLSQKQKSYYPPDLTKPIYGSYSVTEYYTGAGVEEEKLTSGLIVYPNPASDLITVTQNGSSKFHLSLTDIQGKVVYETDFTESTATISVSDLKAGLYILTATSSEGISRQKLLISR
jgi:hypothetical protein